MKLNRPQSLARSTIDGTLFWGVFAAVLGVFFTVMALIGAAHAVQRAGRAEPFLLLGGLKVALSATAVGLAILLVSALLWLGLVRMHRDAVPSEK